jgi:hypothetical protein
MNSLQAISQEVVTKFTAAKEAGKLDLTHTAEVAVELAKKVYCMASLSASDQDAVILQCLKDGLAAVGLPEAHLSVAEAVVKAIRAMIGEPLKMLSCSFLPCYKTSAVGVVNSADLEFLKRATGKLGVSATQESVASPLEIRQVAAPQDTPLQNTLETEPTPLASQ